MILDLVGCTGPSTALTVMACGASAVKSLVKEAFIDATACAASLGCSAMKRTNHTMISMKHFYETH